MADFELFWEHYPIKKAKGYSRKRFEALKKKKILPKIEILIKAIHDQAKERKHLRDKSEFVPPWKHPSTWLNQECWDDECILPKSRPRPVRVVDNYQNMLRAYNVLSKIHPGDMNKFDSFCDQVRLPAREREMALNKFNGYIPDNLKPKSKEFLQAALRGV